MPAFDCWTAIDFITKPAASQAVAGARSVRLVWHGASIGSQPKFSAEARGTLAPDWESPKDGGVRGNGATTTISSYAGRDTQAGSEHQGAPEPGGDWAAKLRLEAAIDRKHTTYAGIVWGMR